MTGLQFIVTKLIFINLNLDIVLYLSKLTNLTTLRVTSHYSDSEIFKYDVEFNIRLPSLRILHLNCTSIPYAGFYYRLAQMFHLVEVRFENSGIMVECFCDYQEKDRYPKGYILFDGGRFQCDICSKAILSLMRSNKSLQHIYRNTNVVYDRTVDMKLNGKNSAGLIFKERLFKYGQSSYGRKPSDE